MLQTSIDQSMKSVISDLEAGTRYRLHNKRVGGLFDLPTHSTVSKSGEVNKRESNQIFKLPIKHHLAKYFKPHDTYMIISACEQLIGLLRNKKHLNNISKKLLSSITLNDLSVLKYGRVDEDFLVRTFQLLNILLVANRAVMEDTDLEEIMYSPDNHFTEYWLSADYIEPILAKKYGLIIRYSTAQRAKDQSNYQKTLLSLKFLESLNIIERARKKNDSDTRISSDFGKLHIKLNYFELFNFLIYVYGLFDKKYLKYNFRNLEFATDEFRDLLLESAFSFVGFLGEDKKEREKIQRKYDRMLDQIKRGVLFDLVIEGLEKSEFSQVNLLELIKHYRNKADKKNWSGVALVYMLFALLMQDKKDIDFQKPLLKKIESTVLEIAKLKSLTSAIVNNQIDIRAELYKHSKNAYRLYDYAQQSKLPSINRLKEAEKFADIVRRLLRGGFGALVGKYISSVEYRQLREQLADHNIDSPFVGKRLSADSETRFNFADLVKGIERLGDWHSFALKGYTLIQMIVNANVPERKRQLKSPLVFVLDDHYYTEHIENRFFARSNLLPKTIAMVKDYAYVVKPVSKRPSRYDIQRYNNIINAMKDLANFLLFICENQSMGFTAFNWKFCKGDGIWKDKIHRFIKEFLEYYYDEVEKDPDVVLRPGILKPGGYYLTQFLNKYYKNDIFNLAQPKRYIKNYLTWKTKIGRGMAAVFLKEPLSPTVTGKVCPKHVVDILMKAKTAQLVIIPLSCVKKLKMLEEQGLIPKGSFKHIKRELKHKS